MKRFLPSLLLLLPVHAALAQYHPSYSPPVRTFTPTPYQTQQRTQQYAHETFQRMQSQ
ncbi:MAG: hypothetical protein ACRYFX_22085 [Janthinobacterium lividum]